MFIYKTTNLVNGMIYVGQHNGKNKDYLGSGVGLVKAIKEFGENNSQYGVSHKGWGEGREVSEETRELNRQKSLEQWDRQRNNPEIIKEATNKRLETITNWSDERKEEYSQKLSNVRKGRIPWNKGLTKETDERVMKISDSNKKTKN